MGASSKETKEISKEILQAIKSIAPKLAQISKKTNFEIIITSDKEGLGVEFTIDWEPQKDNQEMVIEVLPELNIEEQHRESVKKALQRANGNKRIASELLGVSERSLYKWIKKYDL